MTAAAWGPTHSSAAGVQSPLDGLSNSVNDANTIVGEVERVRFHAIDTGFCVLSVRAQGRADPVCVVGHLQQVREGDRVSAQGAWHNDRKWGQQFKADFLQCLPPDSIEGIERYLASGVIKGIGRTYAKKLVAHFGEGVLDIIDQSPERLVEVPGIGKKRGQEIAAAWTASRVVRNIMVFLHGHGISASKAVRIHKALGDRAIDIIRSDPYVLAREIHGIGFPSADKIAASLGIDRNSPLRARAGLGWTLEQCAGRGHCAMPVEELIAEAATLLGIHDSVLSEALAHETEAERLVMDSVRGSDAVFLPHLYYSEKGIASRVRAVAAGDPPWPKTNIEQSIAAAEAKMGFPLAAMQRQAVVTALDSKAMVLTGGPGTGKSTILNAILGVMGESNMRILLAAPTGRAAKRVSETTGLDGKTVHRLLEPDPINGGFKRNEDNPLECDVLVIDEFSMMDTVLTAQLLKAVPDRAAMLFVGDVDQLPSVGPGRVLADLIESGCMPVVRLTEVFRQAAQSRIITNAHLINQGHIPDLAWKEGEQSDFFFIKQDSVEEVAGYIVDLVRERLPAYFGFDPCEIQVLCPMQKGGAGAKSLNQLLQQAINPPSGARVERFGVTYTSQDKVMQIVNNYDKDVYNGDIGVIQAINAEKEMLLIDFDGRLVEYAFDETDEISLAYATSIHKSQGSEYKAVVIPITTQSHMMNKRNLIYTGVTRGKRLVVMVGQQRALAMSVRTVDGVSRITKLREWLAAA